MSLSFKRGKRIFIRIFLTQTSDLSFQNQNETDILLTSLCSMGNKTNRLLFSTNKGSGSKRPFSSNWRCSDSEILCTISSNLLDEKVESLELLEVLLALEPKAEGVLSVSEITERLTVEGSLDTLDSTTKSFFMSSLLDLDVASRSNCAWGAAVCVESWTGMILI